MSDIEISDGPKEAPKAVENSFNFSTVMKDLSVHAEKLNTNAQTTVDKFFSTAGEVIAGCTPTEKICTPRGDLPTWPKPQPQPKPKH